MSYGFLDIAITPSVRAVQAGMGVDHLWADFKGERAFERFTQNEAAFIGFVKVIDETTLAFADYRGNRQYISVGNLAADGRVALILMDYARRARLKIYAHAEIVAPDDDRGLAAHWAEPAYRGRPERLMKLKLRAFDWNCPQHITPRFTEAEIAQALEPLKDRLAALEMENRDLRAKLALGGDA